MMLGKVTLIYPPASDPRAPQLALPSLAASLRASGVEVTLLDLNLSSILALLRPDHLLAAGRSARRGVGSLAGKDRATRLATLADMLVEHAPQAVTTLRDPRSFYDANQYNAAREIIFSALELCSASCRRQVDFGLLPIRYDVRGADPQCLSSLMEATADPEANLFLDHWERDVFPELATDPPDLVGVSITNRQQILPGLMLARALRDRGHFVVLGGAVYSKFVDALQARPEFFEVFADAVIVYEGETALGELLRQVRGPRLFEEVPNLLYLSGDRVRFTRSHVEDVQGLQTPDFTGLPLWDYLAPSPVLPILTGKGCYFNRCRFCDIPYINHVSPKAYRVRDPRRIASDVQSLAERFGSRHFVITDEALSPRLLEDLSAAFEDQGGGPYSFTGYARLEAGFTDAVCRRIRQMGMIKLFFGLESASQHTLDHMQKGTRVEVAPQVLRSCRDAGIGFHLFSIIGFPEEGEDAARETLKFFLEHRDLIEHPGNSFDIHPFGLELRTAYFADRERLGIVVEPEAIRKDFPIGIRKEDWQNRRGLHHTQVDRLLDEEFYPALRQAYRRYHNVPCHLWPGFEEYAVLYGRWYERRAFPFVSALPAAGEGGRFRTLWSPAAAVVGGGSTVLVSRRLELPVPSSVFQLIADERFRTLQEFLQEGTAAFPPGERGVAERTLRDFVDRLIGLGLVQVEVAREGVPTIVSRPGQRPVSS